MPKLGREADANDEFHFGHLPRKRRQELLDLMQDLVRKHGWTDKPVSCIRRRMDQAGKSTFLEFLSASWRAGVVRYNVDFAARTATDYGLDDEKHVEEYPEVQLP